jgi:hypothetical protein
MARLYEHDFTAWAEETAQLLKAECFNKIDMDALIEEIEGLAGADRKAIRSQLRRLLFHLIKLRYLPDHDYNRAGRGWRDSVIDARREIENNIENSPSLARYPAMQLDSLYGKARQDAVRSQPSLDSVVPQACPWFIEQILDPDFFPALGEGAG